MNILHTLKNIEILVTYITLPEKQSFNDKLRSLSKTHFYKY